MNEVFGEENFLAQIIIESNKRGQTYNDISKTHEYLLVYRSTDNSNIAELEKMGEGFALEDEISGFETRELRNRNPRFGRFNRPNLFYPIYASSKNVDKHGFSAITLEKTDEFSIEIYPLNSQGTEGCWRWGTVKFLRENNLNTYQSNVVARKRRDGGWNIYEKYRKTTYKVKSIWDEVEMTNENGTLDLKNLGLGGVFDFPKPLALIKKVLQISTTDSDIVIDFFSGSGTTAQAIMELCNENKEKRQFILVQLPAKLDPDKKEQIAAVTFCNEIGKPQTIAEITKERVRRVSKKLKTEGATGDLGFKVLKLERSNFIKWRTAQTEEEVVMQAGLFAKGGTLIPAWKRANVLTEIMLLEGYPLDSSVQASASFLPNNVEIVTHPELGTRLLICLDETPISQEAIDVLEQPEFAKDVFICLERAITDELKARAADRVLRVKAL